MNSIPSWRYLKLSKIIVIGASTGGPKQIERIIKALPPTFGATVVIAQHMDNQYIPSFVKRLACISPLGLRQMRPGLSLDTGGVYVCTSDCAVQKKQGHYYCITPQTILSDYNPSVDTLFDSVSRLGLGSDLLGVVLTGIGSDGAAGLASICKAGGVAMVENKESSVVYGMPQRAKELSPCASEYDLQELIEKILEFGSR